METPNLPETNIKVPVKKVDKKVLLVVSILIVVSGLGVGFLGSRSKMAGNKNKTSVGGTVLSTKTESGIKDVSAYKDGPIGTLQKGGIDGEGIYHLTRPGGNTQTVYLNSTTVDMSPFVDKKVQVWGDTQAAHSAPWLMDVVKIKVVE